MREISGRDPGGFGLISRRRESLHLEGFPREISAHTQVGQYYGVALFSLPVYSSPMHIILALGLISLNLFATQPKASSCHLALSTYRRHDLGAKAWTALKDTAQKPLAEYFTADASLVGNAYLVEQVARFERDVQTVLFAKADALGFPIKKFSAWLMASHLNGVPLPDRLTLQTNPKATLGEYVEELVLEFARDRLPVDSAVGRFLWLKRANAKVGKLFRRVFIGLGAALFMTAVWQVQGPISGFANVPLAPITDYTSRLGTRYLSWTASGINNLVNVFDGTNVLAAKKKEGLQDAQTQLLQSADALGKYDFNGLSRDQAKQIWDQFETRWFDLAQNISKLLNSDESYGRHAYFAARIETPEHFALRITDVRTNIEVTKASMDRIRDAIDTRGDTEPNAEEAVRLEEYEKVLRFDKHLMSLVIADWMVTHFFHPERWNASQLQNSGVAAFTSIDEYLGFHEFAATLKDEIENIFMIVDASLKPLAGAIGQVPR